MADGRPRHSGGKGPPHPHAKSPPAAKP
jgi:hypothetical protein